MADPAVDEKLPDESNRQSQSRNDQGQSPKLRPVGLELEYGAPAANKLFKTLNNVLPTTLPSPDKEAERVLRLTNFIDSK